MHWNPNQNPSKLILIDSKICVERQKVQIPNAMLKGRTKSEDWRHPTIWLKKKDYEATVIKTVWCRQPWILCPAEEKSKDWGYCERRTEYLLRPYSLAAVTQLLHCLWLPTHGNCDAWHSLGSGAGLDVTDKDRRVFIRWNERYTLTFRLLSWDQ